MKSLKLMADYQSFPLWHVSTNTVEMLIRKACQYLWHCKIDC